MSPRIEECSHCSRHSRRSMLPTLGATCQGHQRAGRLSLGGDVGEGNTAAGGGATSEIHEMGDWLHGGGGDRLHALFYFLPCVQFHNRYRRQCGPYTPTRGSILIRGAPWLRCLLCLHRSGSILIRDASCSRCRLRYNRPLFAGKFAWNTRNVSRNAVKTLAGYAENSGQLASVRY